MKDLDALFDSMEKQKQKDNLVKDLKENPLQATQFKNLIMNNENQKIENQKKAEYQAWKKANQPPRPRVYTSAELNARNSRK